MNNTSKPIDHEYTRQAVCPYCGDVDEESYELGGHKPRDYGDAECESCGRFYHWRRHVSVKYSTERAEISDDDSLQLP